MSHELYMPISCLLTPKIAEDVNKKLELIYKFAQENMISFSEVPEYLSEILKNNKYASSGMKASLSELPDFIFKLAELKNDSYFIKTAQEEGEEKEISDGSDSWTRSWWANVLGFIPGVGGVISLINIYKYSYRACMSEGALSWPCAEFVFDLLVIILDVTTIAGIAGALPTAGTSAAVSATSIAAGTVIRAMKPVIKVVMLGEKITRPIRMLLKSLGKGFIKILEMAGIKASSVIQWLRTKQASAAPGVLVRIYNKLERMFISFKTISSNIIARLKIAIKETDEFMDPLVSPVAKGRGSKALKKRFKAIKDAGQLEGRQILQWCSYFREGQGWGKYYFSINALRAGGLLKSTLESVANWFMSEGAQDIENQISEIENEVKNNPNVLVDGDQMRTKIRSIIEQSSQKLVAKLRSEGKNETEIAKTKEFYVKYMLDIMGGAVVSEYSEETNVNSGNMNELLDSTYGYGGRTFENMSMIPQTSN